MIAPYPVTINLALGQYINLAPNRVSSNLHEGEQEDPDEESKCYHAAIHGMESFLLALYMEGVDCGTDQIARAVKTAVEAAANNLL